jgi:hypothetical protein
MRTYPPFSTESCCPKCGHDDISTTYLGIGQGFGYTESGYGHEERLRRQCRRCNYFWYEAPLDSAPAPTGADDARG